MIKVSLVTWRDNQISKLEEIARYNGSFQGLNKFWLGNYIAAKGNILWSHFPDELTAVDSPYKLHPVDSHHSKLANITVAEVTCHWRLVVQK